MNGDKITRRGLLLGGLTFAVAGCTSTLEQVTAPLSYALPEHPPVDSRFKRQRVQYSGPEVPGTIVVNTSERFLYAVEPDGWATRYGVGVGENGLTFKGTAVVGRKSDWPAWTPTASMLKRKPHLAEYAGGVPGGPNNPLGARALYLYRGGHDSMFRVHGTNEPWTIGREVSNGCIRMTNDDIIDLYGRTPVGTDVLVI
ncbi:MAG: L,D-transpeptidase [Mesorhizobium sp.]|jgi:lipoprotein-anchoring transpeptidase ErfK/SrfK